MSIYGVFSGPDFAAFVLNTEVYSVLNQIFVFSPNIGKYGPENTPYMDTYHAVVCSKIC